MNADLPPPPRRDAALPRPDAPPRRPDAQPPARAPTPIWKRWWFWVAVVVAVAAIGTVVGVGEGRTGADEAALYCPVAASAWLDTLETAFYPEFQDAPGGITSSAYVEVDTSEGTAYYVAVTVDGVSGVAVFGTSEPPLQSDPGLIAAANEAATQLSDLGADIPEDSPAGALLLDDDGVSAVQSCKLKSI
jgi:hypothetical protein